MVWIDVMDITKWSISGSEKSVPAKDHQSKRLRCVAIVPSYGNYVAYAYLAGRVHRAVPSNQNRQTALRQPMAARDQARWLPHHCSQERRAGEALQPPRQRPDLPLSADRRGARP